MAPIQMLFTTTDATGLSATTSVYVTDTNAAVSVLDALAGWQSGQITQVRFQSAGPVYSGRPTRDASGFAWQGAKIRLASSKVRASGQLIVATATPPGQGLPTLFGNDAQTCDPANLASLMFAISSELGSGSGLCTADGTVLDLAPAGELANVRCPAWPY